MTVLKFKYLENTKKLKLDNILLKIPIAKVIKLIIASF